MIEYYNSIEIYGITDGPFGYQQYYLITTIEQEKIVTIETFTE